MFNSVVLYSLVGIGIAAALGALLAIVLGPRLIGRLIVKYLLQRRIAWIALLAVAVCTAMMIVIISVMGGWLRMFRQSFHGLSGDVLVQCDRLAGFPYYDDMIERIKRVPDVVDAVPVIHVEALLDIANLKQTPVQVFGYPRDPATGILTIGRVNDFPTSLYQQYQRIVDAANAASDSAERGRLHALADAMKARASFNLNPDIDYEEEFRLRNPRAPERMAKLAAHYPGMICGSGILEIHKDKDGKIVGRDDYKYRLPAKLTLLSIPSKGGLTDTSKVDETYWIIDDSRTKVWQYDEKAVYVPFDVVQRDLGMDEQKGTDAAGKDVIIPARTSEIDIKIRPGADLNLAGTNIAMVVEALKDEKMRAAMAAGEPEPDFARVHVETWEENQRIFLHAIENEKVLVTGLFGFVSLVAIFLIFCIFFMIVSEKTRDVGIIKSAGATNSCVAGIFLGYGLIIGITGAGVGLFFGWIIVRNINEIHAWLGAKMGIVIWDPQVYVFDNIPNTLNPVEVTWIVLGAVILSVLAASWPALRAASMHPVESLRWE